VTCGNEKTMVSTQGQRSWGVDQKRHNARGTGKRGSRDGPKTKNSPGQSNRRLARGGGRKKKRGSEKKMWGTGPDGENRRAGNSKREPKKAIARQTEKNQQCQLHKKWKNRSWVTRVKKKKPHRLSLPTVLKS